MESPNLVIVAGYARAAYIRSLRIVDECKDASYYWMGGAEFWLFALYAKGEVDDLTPKQLAVLREYLKSELKIRNCN